MLKAALEFINLNIKQFATAFIAGVIFILLPETPKAAFNTNHSYAIYRFCHFFVLAVSSSALLVEFIDFLVYKSKLLYEEIENRKSAKKRLQLLNPIEKTNLNRIMNAQNQPTQLRTSALKVRELKYANIIYRIPQLGSHMYRFPKWLYKYLERHPEILK
jgi:hypothetical protein